MKHLFKKCDEYVTDILDKDNDTVIGVLYDRKARTLKRMVSRPAEE